jgi:hypothetical protein
VALRTQGGQTALCGAPGGQTALAGMSKGGRGLGIASQSAGDRGQSSLRGAPGGQTGRSPVALSEVARGYLGGDSPLCSRGVQGGERRRRSVALRSRGGGRRLSVERHGGRWLSLLSVAALSECEALPRSRLGRSRGGRGLGIASLSAGDRGADGDVSRADGRTLGDIVLPKGGNHGPRTHLGGSAATTSPRRAALATRFNFVIKDPQGRHLAGVRRAPFNVRGALSSSALLDTVPGKLRPTTPWRLPAEARRVPASSALLDAPRAPLYYIVESS